MRQLAWLHAVPIPPAPAVAPRPSARPTRQPERVARIEMLRAKGLPIELPAPGAAAYLVEHLMEVGPVSHGAVGAVAVPWSELQAWQDQTGIALQQWEARLLRRLSREFVAETRRAETEGAPSPMAFISTEQQRESVARRIGVEFGAMASAQRERLKEARR